MSYPYLIQGDNLVIVIDNTPHTISKNHITYSQVVDAIKAEQWDRVKEIIEPTKAVINYSNGHISIKDETLYWKNNPVHGSMANRIISMFREGFPFMPMISFMTNLMENPSKRAVDELYPFLEKGQLPITPDGHFLAYKKVRKDYLDCYTGTIRNQVGDIVEMERNQVDDERDRTCSAGLHFCSKDYLNHFGGERIMIVKINPRDVVSIPSDYNDTKGRCCRYEVIGELEEDPELAFTNMVQENAHGVAHLKPTDLDDFFDFDADHDGS
jgi:translation initiation factor IF-1